MLASIIGGTFGLLGSLIGAMLGLAAFIFWLWMLIHAIANKKLRDAEKIAWVLGIIFLPGLGSIIYFLIGWPKGRVAAK